MIKIFTIILFISSLAFADSLVQVELANGLKIKGIAREGKVSEKYSVDRYVVARANDKGAGVRVWNINGSQGYTFYAYRGLTSMKTMAIQREVVRIAKQEALGMLAPTQQRLLIRFPPEEGWSRELYERNKPRIGRNKRKGNPFRGINSEYVHFDYNFDEWWQAYQIHQEKTYQLVWQKLQKQGVIEKFGKGS